MTNENDSLGDIGNREWDMRNGSGSRKAEYTANNLNQYTSRTVPGALDILGAAHSNSTITVNGQAATRQGAYYHQEIAGTNDAAAVWQPISVVGTLSGTGTNNPDIGDSHRKLVEAVTERDTAKNGMDAACK